MIGDYLGLEGPSTVPSEKVQLDPQKKMIGSKTWTGFIGPRPGPTTTAFTQETGHLVWISTIPQRDEPRRRSREGISLRWSMLDRGRWRCGPGKQARGIPNIASMTHKSTNIIHPTMQHVCGTWMVLELNRHRICTVGPRWSRFFVLSFFECLLMIETSVGLGRPLVV